MEAHPLSSVEAVIGSPAYEAARRHVFVQLVEALLCEKLVPYTTDIRSDTGEETITIDGCDERGQAVRYACRGKTTASFGRIRLSGSPIARIQGDDAREAVDAAVFLAEISRAPGTRHSMLPAFVEEIEQTVLKHAAALHWRILNGRRLDGRRTFDDLEGDILEGHPYHPCFKSRIGFTLADNAAYGPEFRPRIRLQWLAVRQDAMEASTEDGASWEAIVREDIGSAAFERLRARLADSGRDPADYLFVPIHPWQWRSVVAPVFHRYIAMGRIVPLGEGEALYSPQQSVRSLANRTDPLKLTVKLALGIRNTSSLRTISPRHARNGPLVSSRLSAIVQGDSYLRDELKLILLRERLGMSFRYEQLPAPVRASGYGALGAIWRDSVHRYLEPGEEAVPFTALCHIREDGRPYIDGWIRTFGVAAWLDTLLDVTLRPILHLLFKHGVAIESHGQNLILVHRGGIPVRLAARDFSGGVLWYDGTNADPSSLPETDRKAEVRDVVHNALFFVNLAELARSLEVHYKLPEERFWQSVADAIRRYEREHPELGDAYAAYSLFEDNVFVGRLAARRLCGEDTPRDHWLRNALHPVDNSMEVRA